jgi:hypothetical protein
MSGLLNFVEYGQYTIRRQESEVMCVHRPSEKVNLLTCNHI